MPDTAAARNDLNKELMSMSKECLEQAKTLKETLKSEGISSGVFDAIIEVINKRADFIKRSLT